MLRARLFLVCLLSLVLNAKTLAGYTAPALDGARKVLFLGDSLTVGPFGREMQSFLCEQVSERRVYIYASCGASPENWLDEEPPYVSKCGFRVKTPSTFLLGEFEKGNPPKPFSTPKLSPLLNQIRPTMVVVQMGTNWFEMVDQHSDAEDLLRLGALLERFADAIQNAPGRPDLVWITPPDSSRFRAVQGRITKLLTTTGKRKRFTVIDSSNMVRYEPGHSGGDGVHYFGADAAKWAEGVKKRLRNLL